MLIGQLLPLNKGNVFLSQTHKYELHQLKAEVYRVSLQMCFLGVQELVNGQQ